jgi:Pentapeptide repeats (8 copies)
MPTAVVPEIVDLAGPCPTRLHYLHVRARITALVDRYLSLAQLNDRLNDRLATPSPALPHDTLCHLSEAHLSEAHLSEAHLSEAHLSKVLAAIDLQAFPASHIIGIEPELFSTLLSGLVEGNFSSQNDLGMTTPDAASPIAQILAEQIQQAWSSASVCFWLMAHSTGALQAAIAQPLQTQLSHLVTLWIWSGQQWGESFQHQFQASTEELILLFQPQVTPPGELRSDTPSPPQNPIQTLAYGIELTFAFLRVILRLREWHRTLNPPSP